MKNTQAYEDAYEEATKQVLARRDPLARITPPTMIEQREIASIAFRRVIHD